MGWCPKKEYEYPKNTEEAREDAIEVEVGNQGRCPRCNKISNLLIEDAYRSGEFEWVYWCDECQDIFIRARDSPYKGYGTIPKKVGNELYEDRLED